MNHELIPVLIIGLIYGCLFNLAKKLTHLENNLVELCIIKISVLSIISLAVFLIYECKYNVLIDKIKKLDNKIWTILILSSFLEIITVFLYFYSLKFNDVSWSIPMIETVIILSGIFISLCVFKESLTLPKIIGICLILSGVFLFYNN